MGDENQELAATVSQVLDKYQHDKSMLVSILQDIQAKYRYLPKDALKQVCEGLIIPLTQVYSVATFFKAFSLLPRGRYLINVCLGTACHVRGADKVLEKIERELGINAGATTKDLKFTLETVNCVGACALGPIVKVDEEYHGEMTTDKVVAVLKNYT
ncbi:MAG: NADH-quinone oxidoreductase subunit NuoE [Chloroflexi bacterium]|nr:NADH-quinone oxidoreductase subunit NuoE [Chloroflexota bacterium]